ncbi:H-NS family nucleoid-associated regulatory protein [Rubrivivax gelatinosus]|uniref:H-NS histone family protein n=1 Tax=Rubrivivax gelatinosus (strain NBRC 100245 / IL144) TaxID=983917 RepID=I0HQ61_RUBGI|nr:H-NS family nucleoid-associated regulatory protein [Rubrivivax gelatinosus]BAL95148.1 H-NS histone family protein [Rubrivivax gelatinosus IL144]
MENQLGVLQDAVGAGARERAAQEIRELVARFAISETDLRRALSEVERERERRALVESRKAEQDHRRARERALHVARQLVEFWRIEPRELAARQPRAAQVEATPAVRYRHPVTGESWDGLGGQPEWLRRALGKEGYRVAELQPGTDDFARAAATRVRSE